MCNPFGGQKVTKNVVTTAPAPPPAAAMAQSAAVAQGDVVREEDRPDSQSLKIKRRGRDSLRIRLDAGNTGAGTGINVPRA